MDLFTVYSDLKEDGDSRGEFDLDGVRGGFRCLNTEKGACLGLSSEFAFPLGEGRRRAFDQLPAAGNCH